MATSQVPQEIVEEILQRLTVKDLVRFKCLSKSCNFFISNPEFSKLHLKLNVNASQKILISTCFDLKFLDTERAFRDDGIPLATLNFSPEKMQLPPRLRIMGSCNGLIALFDIDQNFFLWNPSTAEYKKLPAPLRLHRTFFSQVPQPDFYTGFGYDSFSDDYKVLFGFRNAFVIFSLKQNSWLYAQSPIRPIPVGHSLSFRHESGLLVHGALHWLLTPDGILVFDLKMERFRTLPTPFSYCYHLRVLDGNLCLTQYRSHPNSNFYTPELWVMKEYGVSNSWTELCTLPQKVEYGALCISKGNTVISITDKELVRCDSQSAKYVPFSPIDKICRCNRFHQHEAILHDESLISPNYI